MYVDKNYKPTDTVSSAQIGEIRYFHNFKYYEVYVGEKGKTPWEKRFNKEVLSKLKMCYLIYD